MQGLTLFLFTLFFVVCMFLKICFYLPVLALILWHLTRLTNPSSVLRWQKKDREESRSYEQRKISNSDATHDFSGGHITRSLISIMAIIWYFLGLLSSSWFVFGFGLLGGTVISLLTIPIKKTKARVIIGASFHAVVLLFAVINSFHLHLRAGSFWSWWLSIM